VLRTLDESLALREQAQSVKRAVVIGAGFIGCEVAASLRALGTAVTIVEPQPAPLASVLGPRIGELVARLHRDEGVDVRCGVSVSNISGANHVEMVHFSDGTKLDADMVVVGIGSRPSTDWLDGSGVKVDNGVVCDEHGRTSAPSVWAIGDVASWQGTSGHQVRVEHWSNVIEQARVHVRSGDRATNTYPGYVIDNTADLHSTRHLHMRPRVARTGSAFLALLAIVVW
jgi:NADPH-dependent 2,4-dienoyl-CoA reductase/sulfur reductase-like enzyme